MAFEFFDYDPLTGITKYFDYDEDAGNVLMRSEGDSQASLEAAAAMRASGISDAKLKQDNYGCLYATIPPAVEMELLKKGIKLGDPNATADILREINQNYPWCKTTDKIHQIAGGNRSQVFYGAFYDERDE